MGIRDKDLAVWFTPDAIRQHLEDEDGESRFLRGLADDDLREAALAYLSSADELWNVFDGACHAIVEDARENMKVRPEDRRQFVLVGYSEQELRATPDYTPPFRPGDLLAELPEKVPESDSIVVVRLEDDVEDSVWPEEVREL